MWQRRIKDLIRAILPPTSESQQSSLPNSTLSGGSDCSTSHETHDMLSDSSVSGSGGSATGSGSLSGSNSTPEGSGGSFPAQHDGSSGHSGVSVRKRDCWQITPFLLCFLCTWSVEVVF